MRPQSCVTRPNQSIPLWGCWEVACPLAWLWLPIRAKLRVANVDRAVDAARGNGRVRLVADDHIKSFYSSVRPTADIQI